MSRIRTVKPELFKHDELFDAEIKHQLPLRIAFIGLFTCCDREGRFKWRPRRLKTDILPYDEVDAEQVFNILAQYGFIKKYIHQDEAYGYIPSWHKHQHINHRETASVLPAPQEHITVNSITSNLAPIIVAETTTTTIAQPTIHQGSESIASLEKAITQENIILTENHTNSSQNNVTNHMPINTQQKILNTNAIVPSSPSTTTTTQPITPKVGSSIPNSNIQQLEVIKLANHLISYLLRYYKYLIIGKLSWSIQKQN